MKFIREFQDKLNRKINNCILNMCTKSEGKSFNFKSSTTKYSMNSSCTLKLSAETEFKKKEINNKLKAIVKKYINTPEKLIQYCRLQGIKVYNFKNADKLLQKLGEEEGFITPLKGLKALILNLIIGIIFENKICIKFTTNEMMVFNLDNSEIYTIARALHKYYGFKNNLPGFDYTSQETFKRVYNKRKTKSPFANCSVKEMYACKEAIARDLESINFTIQLSVEYENSKKALEKITEKTGACV